MNISKEIAERIDKRLNITTNPEYGLESILNFDFTKRDDKYFTDKDYFKYLYLKNSSIIDAQHKIINFIKGNHKYLILHSYGRNGKSSFLNLLEFESNEFSKTNINTCFEFFDFQGNTNMSNSRRDSFQNSTHFFFNKFIFKENTKDFLDERFSIVRELNLWLDNNPIEGRGFDSNKTYEFNNLFSQFRYKIGKVVDFYFQNYDEARHNEIKEKTKEDISEILNNLDESQAGELFAYVLLLYLIKNKDFFSSNKLIQYNNGNRRKIIFVLDNIDDILSNEAEDIATNYTYYICKFIDLFDSLDVKLNTLLTGFDINTDISLIFSFRTANYVNAIKICKENSESQNNRHGDLFHNAPSIRITSVKDSKSIIKRRYLFYKEMCSKLDLSINPKYKFLEDLLIALENSEYYSTSDDAIENYKDLVNIFRLWNGNREVAFNKYFFTYLDSLDTIPSMANPGISYLTKGTYINVLLKPFIENNIGGTLSDVIQYFFNSFDHNIQLRRCSLQRLAFSIILNKLQDNDKYLRDITCSQDLHDKGVSLFELLELIKDIDNEDDEAYSLYEILELLNTVFFEEIDEWSHLLTCTKSTTKIKDDKKVQGKYLNFNEDFEKYKTYKSTDISFLEKTKLKNELSEVRFYYNDSCYYLITHVHRHFEYYSLFLDSEKPLILHYGYEKSGREYIFEFESCIEKVLSKVSEICESTLFFYEDHFYKKYSPLQYTQSVYALNKKFYFDDIISKQHTYIEQFRLYILLYHNFSENRILNRILKVRANKKLITLIKRYHQLFFKCYLKLATLSDDLPASLHNSHKAFTILENKAKKIEEEGYQIFTHQVSTRNMIVLPTTLDADGDKNE